MRDLEGFVSRFDIGDLVPIMAANMDGVGELGIAKKISEFGMITCLTKQHDVKKFSQYKNLKTLYKNTAISIGIKKDDFDLLINTLTKMMGQKGITIPAFPSVETKGQ